MEHTHFIVSSCVDKHSYAKPVSQMRDNRETQMFRWRCRRKDAIGGEVGVCRRCSEEVNRCMRLQLGQQSHMRIRGPCDGLQGHQPLLVSQDSSSVLFSHQTAPRLEIQLWLGQSFELDPWKPKIGTEHRDDSI